MQRNLETRIAALEQAQPSAEPMTIFVYSVPNLRPTYNHIRATDDSMEWARKPGESEKDFTDRASSEAKRNEWGNVILIASEAKEQSHA